MKEVGCGGHGQQIKEFKTFLFCSANDDFPDSPGEVRPSGRENQPGQKFGIVGPCGPDLNIHDLFLFSHRLIRSIG